MRPRVAVMRNMPLHRSQGVAIVGIYPCGKARDSPQKGVLTERVRYPFPLVLHDSRSVLAVKGTLRRFAPWTAPGRSGETRCSRGKRGDADQPVILYLI